MRYFKVLHDFVATDPVELSVRKGDLVCAPERIEQDGWLKVELASDTRRKGFVPATYVREAASTPAAPSAAAVNNAAATAGSSFTTAALSFGEKAVAAAPPSPVSAAYAAALSGAHRPAGSSSSQLPPQHLGAGQGGSSISMPGEPLTMNTSTFLTNPNAVVEAFMKNEVYFKQLMKQRQESLAKLENGIAEALTDITACKDKNTILARKLRDLDVTIEKERKKWKDRVEEERVLIQRAAANTSAMTSNVSSSTVTFQQRSMSQTVGSARNSTAR